MYEPDTDSVIVNAIYDTYIGWHRKILCCMLNLACKPNGLQEYVNAMNKFN